jgi:hypothetical protein
MLEIHSAKRHLGVSLVRPTLGDDAGFAGAACWDQAFGSRDVTG